MAIDSFYSVKDIEFTHTSANVEKNQFQFQHTNSEPCQKVEVSIKGHDGLKSNNSACV